MILCNHPINSDVKFTINEVDIERVYVAIFPGVFIGH